MKARTSGESSSARVTATSSDWGAPVTGLYVTPSSASRVTDAGTSEAPIPAATRPMIVSISGAY